MSDETRQDARGEVIEAESIQVDSIRAEPMSERAAAIGRATQELVSRAHAHEGQTRKRGRPPSGSLYVRTAEARAREVEAHKLYCAGHSDVAIIRALSEGTERSQPCSVAVAREALKAMRIVVEHGRDGRAWEARRTQHLETLHEIKRQTMQHAEYKDALTAMAQIARVEAFDAPQRTLNLHGHAMIGPNAGQGPVLPDGPGVIAGVSVAALRDMPRAKRDALVELLGEVAVARAELPSGYDAPDDEGDEAIAPAADEAIADAEIVASD